MCDSGAGIETGREVYNLLWELQKSGKRVYVLASHSHFIMDDVYRTSYWGDACCRGGLWARPARCGTGCRRAFRAGRSLAPMCMATCWAP